MTEYFIRPGTKDLVPYASGANDGTSYADAFRGLDNATFKTLVNTVSDDVFWICGEHAPLKYSGFGSTSLRFPIAAGLSNRKQKIFRFDYPGDPGIIWGGYILNGTWTETSPGSQIWTITGGRITSSYDDENGCGYAIYFDGTTRRHLVRRATSGECDAEEDTFYVDTSNTDMRVHLSGAGDDPNYSVSPVRGLMAGQYGHRILFTSSTARTKNVWFHGGEWNPLGRIGFIDSGGGTPTYTPHNITWNGTKLKYGGSHIFTVRRSKGLRFIDAELSRVARNAPLYLYTTAVNDQGNVPNSGLANEIQKPRYNNSNLAMMNCKMEWVGEWLRGDGHAIAIQSLAMSKFIAVAMSRCTNSFVWWHTGGTNAVMTDVRVEHCAVDEMWSGEGSTATTNKPIRAFATESGTASTADFSRRTLSYCWVGGFANDSPVEPLYPYTAYRLQMDNPGAFTVTNCVAVDTPCGISMPALAPYLSYDGMRIIDPAGHSTHNIYAALTGNQYTTATAINGELTGLTDEAQMFAVAVSDVGALTTYVSKTDAINPAGTYRYFSGTTFGTANTLTADDGATPLTADDGATALIAA